MAEQSASGAVAAGDTGASNLDVRTEQSYEHEEYHGRPASWVVSATVIVGFIIGGIALPIGPSWVLFWVGTGIVVVGIILGAAAHIMDDWY